MNDSDDDQESAAARAQGLKWLEAREAGLLNPPGDVHDPQGWDTYWKNHIGVGAIDQAFADRVSSDAQLAGLLIRRGARRVLCAGNGLSGEALSLALFGFQVTALDISSVPARVLGRLMGSPQHPMHRIPGCVISDDNTVSFTCPGPIDAELCPPMHRSADHAPKGGGAMSFVTGDLMDAHVCPGPFDVVIERRTVQLFPRDEQSVACERIVGRLADPGIFVSQEHHGGWRPGQGRTHYAERSLAAREFALWSRTESERYDSAPRLAYLSVSTG